MLLSFMLYSFFCTALTCFWTLKLYKLLTRFVQKVGKKPLRDSGTIHLRLSPNFKEFDIINVAAYSSDICFQCIRPRNYSDNFQQDPHMWLRSGMDQVYTR